MPAGFATDLAVLAADGPRAALDAWGRILLEAAGTVRPGRWADAVGSRPSYWTDNGSAYWYKTEPGHDVAGSIVAAVDDLRAKGVPIGAVQLDSWFYPHAELRPFDTDEWVVPPTALTAWEVRPDVLPDGIAALRQRLHDLPLVAHIRHLSAHAPIASETPTWIDGEYAAPSTPEAYERWLDQCVAWGIETFEHDWLVEVFFGVRAMRSEPGRATAWQEGIDAAARDRGITLQWCMGTPADFAQTTTLTQVTSVRTSGDHGYIASAGQLWAWFCTTNALARSLDLMPFKDVFRADPEVAGQNGEPEALLSALSTGPVGLGDRVGRMDPALAHADMPRRRAPREAPYGDRGDRRVLAVRPRLHLDPARGGVRVRAPRRPLDLRRGNARQPRRRADIRRDPARIVVATRGTPRPIRLEIRVADVVAWDWRTGTATRLARDAAIPVSLRREGWAFHVLAPVLRSGLAVIGDVTKFVTAGDARIEVSETSTGVRLVVKGAGETITVTGWAEVAPTSPDATVAHDPSTGIWTLDIDVPDRGWADVLVDA